MLRTRRLSDRPCRKSSRMYVRHSREAETQCSAQYVSLPDHSCRVVTKRTVVEGQSRSGRIYTTTHRPPHMQNAVEAAPSGSISLHMNRWKHLISHGKKCATQYKSSAHEKQPATLVDDEVDYSDARSTHGCTQTHRARSHLTITVNKEI